MTVGLRRFAISALIIACALAPNAATLGFAAAPLAASANSDCALASARGQISHVVYVQFDNVHFTRDNANVPSDLEQMPNLLNFLQQNGALLTNHHTPLIAHTATDFLTSITGLYPDNMGVPVANSFRYFNPNGTTNPAVAFAYWIAPLFDPSTTTPSDRTFNMLTAGDKNAPAPWVPFARAGCNFGAVGMANTVLENTAIDIPTVFGANSPQAAEVKANPGQAFADFVGIAVHCAKNNALCSSSNGGKADVLPEEPGGYSGYNGLFGHKSVAPQVSPDGPLTDLNGNVIQDPQGHVGFPGFDGMSPAVSLSYVAALQEHGVPITYAYISDAHDAHPTGPSFGPGQAGYVATLKTYDDAFGKFFARLANDGLNKQNTLFVFTADEGDHFIGGAPSPAGCDGVTVPCTYNQIGELNTNLVGLLATQASITTPFALHSDSAPTIYITGNPARDASVTRTFDRALGGLTALNPLTGNTDSLANFLADPVEMRLLHMVTADPARTPTLTMFAKPDYFVFAGAPNCALPCLTEQPAFAWNHGDVSPDINTTWLGMVGPGVAQIGVDSTTWSDHSDIRPTLLFLAGLKDDYQHDGRVLVEDLSGWAVSPSVSERGHFLQLARVYKQIEAPVGQLGLSTLRSSTRALESGSSTSDSTYSTIENQLDSVTAQRNSVGGQIIAMLEAAEFSKQTIDEQQARALIDQATALLNQADNI